MSLRPEYHRCLNCGKLWSFNPDVGQFRCPRCHSMEMGPSLGTSLSAMKLLSDPFKKRKS